MYYYSLNVDTVPKYCYIVHISFDVKALPIVGRFESGSLYVYMLLKHNFMLETLYLNAAFGLFLSALS